MTQPHISSFRDPAGYVFEEGGTIYRKILKSGIPDFELLHGSGLYETLVSQGRLIEHEVVSRDEHSVVIRPTRIPFWSYPYEWSFSQLKEAALLTLEIQKTALAHGMTLKDASAYNIQFVGSRPILIDTLSFEHYQEGEPWAAYRQFCQQFLAPLAVAQYHGPEILRSLRVELDGLLIQRASRMLPPSTWFKPSLLSHIHLHAWSQAAFTKRSEPKMRSMTAKQLRALFDHLASTVASLSISTHVSPWSDYYNNTNYSDRAFRHKEQVVKEMLEQTRPRILWDLGANTGHFSRMGERLGAVTVAMDRDEWSVEAMYRNSREENASTLLCLVSDITNPSPRIGWAHEERMSLEDRGPADVVLALALVHHLVIANNIPIPRILEFFSRLGKWLILEFVPKEDSNTKRLLATRKDIFPDYHEKALEETIQKFYTLEKRVPIEGSVRTIYLLKCRESYVR